MLETPIGEINAPSGGRGGRDYLTHPEARRRIDGPGKQWHNCRVNRSAEMIWQSVWTLARPPVELDLMYEQPSDANLVFAAARSRDGEAMTEIVRRYAQLVYTVGHRIADGDAPSAERVARQCVSELAAAPNRVRGELSAWLHQRAVQAARATVNGHGASNGRRPRDPAEEPGWDELRHYLDPALSRLSHRHRHIIIQHYFQRHSQDELAEMLQVAQPVVARRLRKALDRLRTELVRDGAGCSLAQLMMLLARHGTSEAPPALVEALSIDAQRQLAESPLRRGRRLAKLAAWSLAAGMLAAVAMAYLSWSSRDDASDPNSTTLPARPGD